MTDQTAASLDAAAARDTWEEVTACLGRPETHGILEPVVRIDTHAAVVFLAGPLAFKIKRPVRFPFLDFSTPQKREAACRREIAVDRPIAPEIYRRVVAVTRETDGTLAIDGAGTPVEWAVEMNRFDENATLDRVLARGPLPAGFAETLAEVVARAEANATVRDAGAWVRDVAGYIEQNADAFATYPDLFPPEAAEMLTRRSREGLADLADLLDDRGRLGRVRLGHGDLHCGNVVVIDGRPQLFDAIEFDDAIATGDVLYDVAFLIMDLEARGDRASARALLDRWRVETVHAEAMRPHARSIADLLLAEIEGFAALPLWLSIRAALRAKIAAATAAHVAPEARAEKEAEARRFFAIACERMGPHTPCLVAMGGLSGAGKTTLARALAVDFQPAPGALVLRTDTLRKLLAGVGETARLGPEHYTREASERVYHLLCEAASTALAAGRSVVTDAVSLHPEERQRFQQIAEATEADFVGLWLDVDPSVAAARVGTRVDDASDADAAVVAFQADRGPGRLDWLRIDASGTPEETLMMARRALELARG